MGYAPDRDVTVETFAPETEPSPLTKADHIALAQLIDADALPGQPAVRPERLPSILTGVHHAPPFGWSDLIQMRVAIARRAGVLVGAMAYATTSEGVCTLLWMHAREEMPVVSSLIDALSFAAGSGAAQAFVAESPFGACVLGLCARARPVSASVLRAHGFAARRASFLVHHPSPGAVAPPVLRRMHVQETDGVIGLTRRFVYIADAPVDAVLHFFDPALGGGAVERDPAVEAFAEVEMIDERHACCWSLEVDEDRAPDVRVRLGEEVLRGALTLCAREGARSLIIADEADSPWLDGEDDLVLQACARVGCDMPLLLDSYWRNDA